MAFVKVNKSRMGIVSDYVTPNITMGAYLADGKVHKGKSIAFRISQPLIQQLGWKMSDGKLFLSVQEGTETDEGYLAIVVDNEHGYSASQGKSASEDRSRHGVSISITYDRFKHYTLNECPVSSSIVNHIVDGDVLIVETPDWFRFNPLTKVEKQELPVVETKPEVKEPTRPLPRQSTNAVDKEEADVRLNRRERRAVAQHVTRLLRK